MTAGKNELLAFLDRLGVEAKTHDHPPLHTVEESRSLRGAIPGGHTKNLFLKDRKGRVFLLVALEDAEIDLKSLPALIGCGRLSFANAVLMQALLGVSPGAVTPFGLVNDTGRRIEVLLDEEMMACPLLNFHPLRNDATTTIASADLLRFIAACGHEPRIVRASAGRMEPRPAADAAARGQGAV